MRIILLYALLLMSFSSARLNAEEPGQSPGAKDAKPEAKPLEVSIINARKFSETLKKLKGKIVVINMWATWCVPCRKEFPILVQLYQQYKSRGMELLAISNDDFQNLEDVKDFVREQHAQFPAFIVDPDGANDLREAIYPEWTGGLPSTFFFDRHGDLKGKILGMLDREEFEDRIKPLL
ncbi:MAG: TlpA family protein disulfide reductase [Acidobacteriia bacterium]|nr:TlpA family protein disulfide reductase [Terriglobia bacterium]